jgi:hypothetical protein
MPRISKSAALSKVYTNHSLRATSVTLLDNANQEGRHIITMTEHKSVTSLQSYSSTSERQYKKMSGILSYGLGGNDTAGYDNDDLSPPVEKRRTLSTGSSYTSPRSLPSLSPKIPNCHRSARTPSAALGAPRARVSEGACTPSAALGAPRARVSEKARTPSAALGAPRSSSPAEGAVVPHRSPILRSLNISPPISPIIDLFNDDWHDILRDLEMPVAAPPQQITATQVQNSNRLMQPIFNNCQVTINYNLLPQ